MRPYTTLTKGDCIREQDTCCSADEGRWWSQVPVCYEAEADGLLHGKTGLRPWARAVAVLLLQIALGQISALSEVGTQSSGEVDGQHWGYAKCKLEEQNESLPSLQRRTRRRLRRQAS